jgi:MraZ protein
MPNAPTAQTLFAGEFRHAVDPKNRITIPARWRAGEEAAFFIIPDQTEAFLLVMPREEFQAVNDRVSANPGISAQERRIFIRQFYSRARECSADKQGRLLLPEEYCRKVGLAGEVVLVGAHARFEIWDPEKRNQYNAEHEETYRRVADIAGL